MKQEILQSIQDIAKKDFDEVTASINTSQNAVKAQVINLKYFENENSIACTCVFNFTGSEDVIEATINYENKEDGIYADADIADVATSVLSAVEVTASTPITAADEDEDAFGFDSVADEIGADDGDFEFGSDEPDGEEEIEEEIEEYEDPEEDPSIETENNIAGHYIAECNRCHGVFISALMESDQQVEFLSGICPLCEKESDQYIKWVIKPVEF